MSSELPDGWASQPLSSTSKIAMGETLLSKDLTGTGVPVFSANTDSGPWGYTDQNRRTLKRGDIVVGARGSIGFPRLPAFDTFTSTQTTITVEPDASVVDSTYLHAVLCAADIKSLAAQQAVPMLTIGMLAPLSIFLPPLDEQRRIAEVLRSLDVAAQASNQVSQSLRAAEQAMIDDLCFHSPEGEWDRVELGTLLEDVRYGTSAKCDADEVSGLPVLRIPNVLGSRINFNDLKFAVLPDAEQRRLSLQQGDIVVVRTNGNPSYVGRSAIVRHSEGVLLYASYLIRLRLNPDRAWAPFIDAALKSSELREALLRSATTSAGNYNINSESLRRLVVPLPTLAEQRRISDVLDAVGAARDIDLGCRSISRETARLVAADLLSGRVRVPE
nr:restriction endonuclease subunit S [Brevundimonas diminuta]